MTELGNINNIGNAMTVFLYVLYVYHLRKVHCMKESSDVYHCLSLLTFHFMITFLYSRIVFIVFVVTT